MEERIAQSVMAGQQSQALAGMFVVVVTPKPGVRSRASCATAVDEEIARIAKDGPTAEELQRAKNRIEAQVIFSLEPVGGFGGRAAHLNEYYWETGRPRIPGEGPGALPCRHPGRRARGRRDLARQRPRGSCSPSCRRSPRRSPPRRRPRRRPADARPQSRSAPRAPRPRRLRHRPRAARTPGRRPPPLPRRPAPPEPGPAARHRPPT